MAQSDKLNRCDLPNMTQPFSEGLVLEPSNSGAVAEGPILRQLCYTV